MVVAVEVEVIMAVVAAAARAFRFKWSQNSIKVYIIMTAPIVNKSCWPLFLNIGICKKLKLLWILMCVDETAWYLFSPLPIPDRLQALHYGEN